MTLHPRLRTACLLVGLLVAVLSSVGRPAEAATSSRRTLSSAELPYFSADLSVAVDSSTQSKVRAVVSVGYRSLNWERADDGYTAGVAIVVELETLKGHKRLYGDSWERRIRVKDFKTTVEAGNELVETREFSVPPGRYAVRVTLRDLRALQLSEVTDRIELTDPTRQPVAFSDLELGLRDSAGSFIAFPARQFGLNVNALAVRATVLDRRPGAWPREHAFHWRVLDDAGMVMRQGDTTVTASRPVEPVVIQPQPGDLFIGGYSIELELREGKTGWRTSRGFEVEESGPPRGREFDQILEALAYIASDAEVNAMRGHSEAEEAELWEAFWRRRDPTPETVRNEYQIEFFRRIRYAEQHFLGFGPGWRSDMGRAYIRYGPPDQIEQRQATAMQPAYEIWSYNQPYRRLVFTDREGFGRYILMNPTGE